MVSVCPLVCVTECLDSHPSCCPLTTPRPNTSYMCLCSVIIFTVSGRRAPSHNRWTLDSEQSRSSGWYSFLYTGQRLFFFILWWNFASRKQFSESCILKVTTDWKHLLDKSRSGRFNIWKVQRSVLFGSNAHLLTDPSSPMGTISSPTQHRVH